MPLVSTFIHGLCMTLVPIALSVSGCSESPTSNAAHAQHRAESISSPSPPPDETPPGHQPPPIDRPVIDQPSIMPSPDDAPAQQRRTRTVPGTALEFTMVKIPAGVVSLPGPDGAAIDVKVGPFWAMTTELTWDLYDVFVFNLDEQGTHPQADAVSRPSRPYIPPDRGFGHAGYPAISMTTRGAEGFCQWLSAKTGRTYRLPTMAEWKHMALAGAAGPYSFADAATIDDHAWTARNTDEATRPVGQKLPNAFGLYDMHGNVMEWVRTLDGKGFRAAGGSYRDEPAESTADSFAEQNWEWNMTDPQIPKSTWWLSDASWVGMRIICDDETVGETSQPPAATHNPAQGHEP